ncbi:hypothetical protein HXX76_008995 [Chlamydomonas incerta]|uniref:Uncharacterized protein n=1 Tax=Chlamydomonas incerta TaxID=51695 RepID=A0A835SS04_CHLIN|nr:hypothetical protein HXX76_008995 [Chlamydomonas incerta]|eukprot:KAG2432068.1 hypothetical protein HXX76_008995 [Chlamydomonas incerta]
MAFLKSLRCPRCGSTALLPILYGFPSAKLLEGMRSKRLILGGDHLIESCHVWGCPNDRCGASYRFFPYDRVDEWMADQAKPQPAGPHYTYEL